MISPSRTRQERRVEAEDGEEEKGERLFEGEGEEKTGMGLSA